MKKLMFMVASTMAALAVTAGMSVSTDRSDAMYGLGKQATFTVTITDASAQSAQVTLDNGGTTQILSETRDLAAANPFTVSGTLDEPGFLRLTVQCGSEKKVWSVGFEPTKIEQGSTLPADFLTYWRSERARLDSTVELDPQVTPYTGELSSDYDNYDVYDFSVATFNSKRLNGYIVTPKGGTSLPVIFNVPAAGEGWTAPPSPKAGYAMVVMNVHPDGVYTPNYYYTGITGNKDDYFFHDVILGIARAVDYTATLPFVNPNHMIYSGTSQGGGMGIILCALTARFAGAVVHIPALTDVLGRDAGRASGWPYLVEAMQTDADKANAAAIAPYYDACNFARYVTCRVRVSAGLSDTVCNPSCVYAMYNRLPVYDKQIWYAQGMGHEVWHVDAANSFIANCGDLNWFNAFSGDVTSLTNALAHTGSPQKYVYVEPGEYDLTGIQMKNENGSLCGSHLYLLYSRIKGLGANPEDTKFIGDGTLRVLRINSNWYGANFDLGARVENICVTNGYSTAEGGGMLSNGTVTNCLIVGCRSDTNGGGLSGGVAYRSTIRGCYGSQGGGVYGTHLYDCEIRDNCSAGWGGGSYGLIAERCVIKNNFSRNTDPLYGRDGDNAAFCNLHFCDISGTTVFGGYGFGCKVHDIGPSITLTGNPFVTEELTKANKSAWIGGGKGWPTVYYNVALTNCLFYNNTAAYQNYNASLFNPNVRSIVNCTVVNNRYVRPFGYANSTENPVVVENSVFVDNYYAYYNSLSDLCDHSWDSPACAAGGVLFKNSVYAKANSAPFLDKANFKHPDGDVYQLGVDGFPADAKLMPATSDTPYATRLGSPLRDIGGVEAWMANSTDILGNPRLTGGKCDIGCYQHLQNGFLIMAK